MKTKMRILSIVITLAMLLGMLPVYSMAADDYPTIVLGKEISVTLDGNLKTAEIYKFVPEKDGKYMFYSYDSDYDTYGHLYNENMEELTYDDDGGDYANFKVVYELEAGKTYYVKGRFYSTDRNGSFKMTINEVVPVEKITIFDDYDNTSSIEINQGDYACLETLAEPKNSVTTELTWSYESDSIILEADHPYAYVYAKNPGTTTVTATTENGISDTIDITVKAATEITVNSEHTITYENGRNGAPMFMFTPSETDTYSIYTIATESIGIDLWFSYFENDELIFEYDFDYEIDNYNRRIDYEFEAGKTYYINASHGHDGKETFTVRLVKPVPATGMEISPNVYSGIYDTTVQLSPSFLPELNAIYESVTYVSSADDIVSVDENGLATLHKIGTATITATSENGHTATSVITVTDIPYITEGKNETVNIDVPERYGIFKFTPEVSGTYVFSSEGSLDTYGYILDAGENILAENDGSTYFTCMYEMVAGTTYLLKARMYSSSTTGTFTVSVTKHEHSISYHFEEYYHEARCRDCDYFAKEDHTLIDGVCACGYCEHEHVFVWYDFYNDENHYSECTKCLLQTNFDHEFDENGKCVCGYFEHEHKMEPGTFTNEYSHDTICSECGFIDQAFHEFDSDNKCGCGYLYHTHSGENFQKDLNSHYGTCDICKMYFEDSEHSYDENGFCSCGAILHDHENKEYVDENHIYHYEICADCGVVTSTDSHDYVDGECVFCGRVSGSEGTPIYIGDDITLYSGQYLASDGTVTDTEPDEWVAHFEDMVLTLKDIDIESYGSGIMYEYAEEELEIAVYGNVNLTVHDDDGIYLEEGDLTFSGTGTLNINVTEDYDGIDVSYEGSLTIEDDVTIIIAAIDSGIEVYGTFIMNGGTVIITAGDEGIDSYEIEINGGTLIAKADNDSLDSDDYITINGGHLDLTAGSSGIEAYGILQINGGIINISSGDSALYVYEPLELAEHMGTVTMTYFEGYYCSMDGDEILTELVLPTSTNTDITVTLSKDSAYYTGKDLTPAVTVKDSAGNILTEDTDYTVDWSNDEVIKEGVYIATVTGIGDYEGAIAYKIFSVSNPVIYVGNVPMHNGDYLANGSDTTASTKPSGGYAYFKDGTLTLHDYVYEGKGYEYTISNYPYNSAIFSEADLEINLSGNSSVTIYGEYSECITVYGNLKITGGGTLTLTGEYGICVYSGTAVMDDGELIINAVTNGIHTYEFTMDGGKITITGEDGIDCESIFEIKGGVLIITAEDCAITSYDKTVISGGNIKITSNYGIYTYNLAINGGYLNIDSSRTAVSVMVYDTTSGIYLAEGIKVIAPENAAIKYLNEAYYFFDEDGSVSTKLTISSANHGDANGDGKINLSDASVILKHVAKWDIAINTYTADTNGDGKVNISDVSLLLKYIAKWDVTLGKK